MNDNHTLSEKEEKDLMSSISSERDDYELARADDNIRKASLRKNSKKNAAKSKGNAKRTSTRTPPRRRKGYYYNYFF